MFVSLALIAPVLASAVTVVDTAAADIEDTRCVVEPATSTGTQSGVTAVAVGEQVRLGAEVDLAAGEVYQDILANPDGSTYVASWVGVEPTGSLAADLASLTLTIGGESVPLVPGNEPRPDGFVLDTSEPMARVYFPGDPAAADEPTGSGAVSFVVPEGGQTLRLTYPATVPDGLAAGEVTAAVSCQAAISYGDANAAVDERAASVAVLGLDAVVSKTADLPVLAPSTTVTYTIEVSVPAFDDAGEVRNGAAFDTVVTDVLPDELDYVAGSASHGGAQSGGELTWTIPEIAAGSSVALTYQLAVPADAPPGATYTNEASAVTTSQPGEVSGEATFSTAADSVTLGNGAETPAIDKTSDVSVAGTGQLVTYDVDLTWPAGSTWHDVTLTDLLPDGMTLADAGSFTCGPDDCPAMTELDAYTDTGGNTRFGYAIDELGPFPVDQTWTWTYTATMVGSYDGGTAVPIGTTLDNLAEVRFNLIPRLGGARPNLARLNDYDGLVGDVVPVTFDRPVIAIDKAGPSPSQVEPTPDGVTYTVTLTNSGGVDATDVAFTDPGPASSGFPLGAIDPGSVTGATFGGGTFTVALVPAGGSQVVTYRVVGSASDPVAVEDAYDNTATVTGYGDPAGNSYPSDVADDATVTVDQPVVEVHKERQSPSPIAGTDGETITYRVTVTNTSDATAYNLAGNDTRDFAGTLLPGSCTGGLSIAADGTLALAELAPDATASCAYQVELDGDQPEGALENRVAITWRNGFDQTGIWTQEAGVQPWTDTDDATTTVTPPQLALQKGPDADTPGNAIINGGTGTYTIAMTNVGAVTATDVVLDDVLPPGLTLEAPPGVTTTPDGVDHTVSGTAGDGNFGITIPALAPGELVQVDVRVRHDGIEPDDDQLVNEATLVANGIATPLTDDGVLQWMPDVELPTADKTVTPASVGIGEQVTWAVTATVPENTVDVHDITFVDTLPRGMVFDAYDADVACTGPLCASVPSPTPLTPATLDTGQTRIGWFVGDVPANTAETTYTLTFTASVASAYSGTGSPAAGTPVTDTTLFNRIQPWLTLTDTRDDYDDGSEPDLSAPSLFTEVEWRAATSTEPVDVETPRVIADKEVTNLGAPFDWEHEDASGSGWMADAGDEISYEVTFTNVGSGTAHDIELTDSMGQLASGVTMLRDVQVTGLPAGVTVLDDWTLADPEVVFHVDELAPDASVTVTYTGVVAPSSELVPGFSGDNRDIALIRNELAVATFSSAPDDGGRAFEDTFATGTDVYVYTPSPYLTGAACVGGSTAPAGTTETFVASTRNGAPPFGERSGTLLTTGFPTDPTVGVGYDTTLTVLLSPDTRYVPGTASIGGTGIADPTTSLDPDASVETLTFDLGESVQGEVRTVRFDVRTIADGVQGGMRTTLAMEDASGAPSRGTASPGAEYVYAHTISRGCGGTRPLEITKYPDLSYRYDGKTTFRVGEQVEWFGSAGGSGAPYHDGEFVDTMPDGIDYTPGSAAFTVRNMDGALVAVSAAEGNLTEVLTPLDDGRTQLRFTSPEFAEFRSISYRLDSIVADDALVGATLTNVIDLITSDGVTGSCSGPTVSVCDNGAVRIVSSAEPTIVKSVDHPAGPWGDVFRYTVDITLPANTTFYDAYIGDTGDYPRALDGAEPYGATLIECLSGCDGDPAPVTLPVYRDSDDFARAWFLGDLEPQLDERLYRVTYHQAFVDADEYSAEFGADPLNEEYVNEATVGWNDTDVLTDDSYQPGGPAHTGAASRTFAMSSTPRGLDQAAVNLIRPELAVDKQCEALAGRDDLATSTSFGGETSGALPNFRCVLTATNATDPALGTMIADPTFVDTVPATSEDGRPVTVQLTSSSSDEPGVVVEPTEVPGSPLDPPAIESMRVMASGTALAPGESVSVTVDLRLTADPAFWDDAALTAERSTNEVAAESFTDLAGNTYASTSTDTWDLVIEKPDLTVSERAWVGDGYDASLADGRPTACMAYAPKPDPLTSSRIFGRTTWNQCSNLKDARSHESSAGGDYARSYGGGAPDVVPGVDDRVTWAVDVAVVNPDDFTTVSIADQIPYGFAYVPGSARLAHWSETGTTHTALTDPAVGTTPAVTCSSTLNFFGGAPGPGTFVHAGVNYGQAPATPLTWTFARGGGGATGAVWDDGLAYLHDGNRGAAGAVDTGTTFDRMVRIVFDVAPTAEFADCVQTPQRSNSFRSEVTATGTAGRGDVSSTSLGWLVGVELATVDKTPDGAILPDGTTATYDIDVTITDPTRLDNVGDGPPTNMADVPGGPGCDDPPLPPSPTRTPWIGLGDLSRNGTPLTATYTGTSYGTDFRSELVVTDTLVDDGRYVPGSATVEMFDPWGRPFAGHLVSEDVETVMVDGRQASKVTWTFDHYPSPLNITGATATFPCQATVTPYVTHPASMNISVPLEIPDGTPDGTTHPNSADATVNHVSGGEVVRTEGDVDDALVTVRNPLPPPPATKTAVPDEVAPGATFEWVVEAELQAGSPWFDLGWVDDIPANMEFLGYGTPTCVLSGTTTPCSGLTPTVLSPIANGDGSTTVGWFVGDVVGGPAARTLRLPLIVRFVGDEVAGDELTNVVTGFSNEDDGVDTLVGPPDPSGFTYQGEPAVGVATVVEPALEITKQVTNGPGPFQAGDLVTYEVTVTNTGTGTAYDVPVGDTPDAALTSVATASPLRSKGWTELDPRVEWFLPTVAPGEEITLDLSGVVASDYATTGVRELTNTATISGYTSRPVSEEHGRMYPGEQAAATVTLVARNLAVEKYAGDECEDPAQAYEPGETVDWCVVVANTGDAPAYGVTLTDLLPPDWAYDDGSAQVDAVGSEPTVSTTPRGSQRLVWDLGDIGPGADHVITYATIGADGSTLVANTAVANSTLEDGSLIPNTPDGFRALGDARAAALGAGLQIAKLPDHQRVACDGEDGCTITWEIVVLNAADVDLDAATVTDYLPAGLAHESAVDASGWGAADVGTPGSGPSSTTPVTWTHDGTFASGEVATFEVTARVPADDAERSFLNHAVARAAGVPDVENQALAEVYTPASLGDLVWHDVDTDGRQDTGEPGIGGVTVQLYSTASNLAFAGSVESAAVAADDTLVATAVTDADGRYHFGALQLGTYRVRFLAPEGWVASPVNTGSADADSDMEADGWTPLVTLGSGTHDPTWDAGLYRDDPSEPVDPEEPEEPGTVDVPPGAVDPEAPNLGSGSLADTGAGILWLTLAAVASIAAGGLGLVLSAPRHRRRRSPVGR